MDICPENFLSFFKHGLDQKFSLLKTVAAPVPVDDTIYKLPSLEGTIEVNVVAARNLRKVTTWFSEATAVMGDDLCDENGSSTTNEIVFTPRPCISYDNAKALKLLDAKKTKLRQLVIEKQEKEKKISVDKEKAAKEKEDNDKKGLSASPQKQADATKTDKPHTTKKDYNNDADHETQSMAHTTAFSTSMSRRPPSGNSAPLHSDPDIAQAEADRMRALGNRRKRHSQDSGKKIREEDSMLRIKTKVRSRVKRSISEMECSEVRAYIGVTEDGKPFYTVGDPVLDDDKCRLGDLWSDLLESVYTICSSKGSYGKATRGPSLPPSQPEANSRQHISKQSTRLTTPNLRRAP